MGVPLLSLRLSYPWLQYGTYGSVDRNVHRLGSERNCIYSEISQWEMDGTQGCIKYIVSRQSETVTRGYLTIENRELEIDFYITKLYNVTDKKGKSNFRKQVKFLHKSVTVQSDTGCFFRKGNFLRQPENSGRNEKLCCHDRASFYVKGQAWHIPLRQKMEGRILWHTKQAWKSIL